MKKEMNIKTAFENLRIPGVPPLVLGDDGVDVNQERRKKAREAERRASPTSKSQERSDRRKGRTPSKGVVVIPSKG